MKKNAIHSIKVKIYLVIDLAVLLTGLMMIINYSSNVKKELGAMTQHYMEDLAIAYGSTLDNEIKRAGDNSGAVLKTDNLSMELDGRGVEEVESSYMYVVAKNGSMLYHPDGGKIGKSVENEVVKKACADLQAGKKVDNGVVSYEFKGETKYAAIYVSTYTDFVLIVTADEAEIFEPIKRVNFIGVLGMIIAAIVCSVIGFFLANVIVKPIRQMTDLTIKISDMDFTSDAMVDKLNKRKDEIGSMGRAISLLRVALVDVARSIKAQSDMLMSAADDLFGSATETSTTMDQVETAVNNIAQGATSQAEETQAATENVVAMGNMVEETNRVVEELVAYASKMKDAGNRAKMILGNLNQVNEKTEGYIDIIAKQTDTTNESAMKISEAASMITDIAEETNLLSLNASIEAARAGEQGRGFAVVASQIQKLAEQSNESAKQIGDIIQVLLQDSTKAVEIMDDVKSSMKEQSDYVEKTDQAFEEIQTEVNDSIRAMDCIFEKTEQMDQTRSKMA